MTWTAVSSGTCTIDTFGSSFDTVLAVYTGDALQSLFRVTSNDDAGRRESKVVFEAVGGVSYHIAVDGFSSTDRGTIAMHVSLVTVAPAILSQPGDMTVNPGSPVTFAVVAVGGLPLMYQWQFEGTDIPGATSASYTITSATAGDDGEYQVVVSNGTGSVTSEPAVLSVRVGPTITGHPVGLVVDPGGEATFTVRAIGTPTLGYQWRLNGVALPGETSDVLTIAGVEFRDGGFYQAIVVNGIGSTISAPAELIVRPEVASVMGLPSGEVQLNFKGVPGRSYVVQGRTDGGDWVDLGTSVLPAASVEGVYTDAPAPGIRVRLYRLRLVQP